MASITVLLCAREYMRKSCVGRAIANPILDTRTFWKVDDEMKKRASILAVSVLAILIFLFSPMCPVLGQIEARTAADPDVPISAHIFFINFREGRATRAFEFYFDRDSMQYREDTYQLKKGLLTEAELEHADMKRWEDVKKRVLPEYVQIFGTDHSYQVSVSEVDPASLESEVEKNRGDGISETSVSRACFIYVSPKKPVETSDDWKTFFAPESLRAHKPIEVNYRNESTGEYRLYEDLYAEYYELALPGAPPGHGDGSLTKIWYDPVYSLPVKRMVFGTRPDSSSYLYSVFLAEYDFSPSSDLFDPESTPFSGQGLPVETVVFPDRSGDMGFPSSESTLTTATDSARTLRFPKDRSMGLLYVSFPSSKGAVNWEFLCEARGDVVAPAGKELKLAVSLEHSMDLSPLAALGPDDLLELDLGNTRVSNAGLTYLNGLTSLLSLDLSGTEITDAGLAHLEALSSLRRLTLRNDSVTDAGLIHLTKLTSLQVLDLTNTRITDEGLTYLTKLPSLRVLNVSYTPVTDEGLAYLRGLSSLKELDISYTQISDAGLAHLEDFVLLENLQVQNTRISDRGLEHLRELASLQTLNVSHTQISDRGLKHIGELRSLQRLYLSDTHITDQGIVFLKDLGSLEVLGLWKTQISDAGLTNLGKLTSLQLLDLQQTKVSQAGVAELKQVLQDCRISR
jgi:hypothetical protein